MNESPCISLYELHLFPICLEYCFIVYYSYIKVCYYMIYLFIKHISKVQIPLHP